MIEIIHLEQTHSTNRYMRQYAEVTHHSKEGTVIWADFQTAGRGQKGNSWESTAGKNLLFSLLLCPTGIAAHEQFIISQVISLALLDVLNAIQPGFSVKWPNDIYYGEKKVAGILIENDLSGHTLYSSIIGVGLNVNQEVFESDAPNPISMKQITGITWDRHELLNELLERIFDHYTAALDHRSELIHDSYMKGLFRNEGYHPFLDEQKRPFEARIKRIDLTGEITLEDKQGTDRTFAFKEVEFVI